MKLSGMGRENSKAAVEHYTQLKSVYVALDEVRIYDRTLTGDEILLDMQTPTIALPLAT